MKQLEEPIKEYSIFITSNQTDYWGQERFFDYDKAVTRYNELLKLSKEFKHDEEQVEQQIHFVKVITKYEPILTDIRMIG